MASILLSGVGLALGGTIATGAVGATVGKTAGVILGSFIDRKLFGGVSAVSEGRRLRDIMIQSASYGLLIPILYGTSRVAGNIIWVSKITEHAHSTSQSIGSKWKKIKHTHMDYTYTVSLAIAVCKGPITSIDRLWADDIPISFSNYNIRIYRGDEEQMPDPLIEGTCGIGKTPAYRGTAYIVIENFNVTEFGNNLPQFSFEVKKELTGPDSVEHMIKSIVMIPGGGEYVYDTCKQYKEIGYFSTEGVFVRQGESQYVNYHTTTDKANSLVSLDQLKQTLPNVEWVAPVVTWFGNSTNAGTCLIRPGVEFKNSRVSPDDWKVAGYVRANAYEITIDKGRPIYGGSVNDASIVRYVAELKSRGYKILFYPMLQLDMPDKPWRGYIAGTPAEIKRFFRQHNGYNEFILHYASLVKSYVDAFIIGSELQGLTKVQGSDGKFPAVDELIALAMTVKGILGPKVKITYAANWGEYHHTDGGWYHLDPLWASDFIDFIGIDAYFPLTEFKSSQYDLSSIMRGWSSGEGFDFYYVDGKSREKKPLGEAYAWKNIEWWWNNKHYNPDGRVTPWQPRSKKIWFTEYGFPSVDCATNQPYVFYDATGSSRDAGYPLYSRGETDFAMQRLAIEATERKWINSDMVENKFLWTWDARPYPIWPDRQDIWADYGAWAKGHWVQGKFGSVMLSQLLRELCIEAGFADSDIDVSSISDVIDGVFINQQMNIRSMIETLQAAFFFDCIESDFKVKFISRKNKSAKVAIDDRDLINLGKSASWNLGASHDLLAITNLQEMDLPQNISINFLDRIKNYTVNSQYASRMLTVSKRGVALDMPLVMSAAKANAIANTMLYNAWIERQRYSFALSMRYMYLNPADVIYVRSGGEIHTVRITSMEIGKNHSICVTGVAEDTSLYDYRRTGKDIYELEQMRKSEVVQEEPSRSYVEILDIPLLPNETKTDLNRLLVAATGSNNSWQGCKIFYRIKKGGQMGKKSFGVFVEKQNGKKAIMGKTLNALSNNASPYLVDRKSFLRINIFSGELYGISAEEMFNRANMALIGDEIVHFKNARLVDKAVYELDYFLRGQYGTTSRIQGHQNEERFIILNDTLEVLRMPISYTNTDFIATIESCPQSEEDSKEYTLRYNAVSAHPLAPTHVRFSYNGKRELILNWFLQVPFALGNDDLISRIVIYDGEDNLLVEDYVIGSSTYAIPINITEKVARAKIMQVNKDGMEGDAVTITRYSVV